MKIGSQSLRRISGAFPVHLSFTGSMLLQSGPYAYWKSILAALGKHSRRGIIKSKGRKGRRRKNKAEMEKSSSSARTLSQIYNNKKTGKRWRKRGDSYWRKSLTTFKQSRLNKKKKKNTKRQKSR